MKLYVTHVRDIEDFEELKESFHWSNDISHILELIEEKELEDDLMNLLDDKGPFSVNEEEDELCDFLVGDLQDEEGFEWVGEL